MLINYSTNPVFSLAFGRRARRKPQISESDERYWFEHMVPAVRARYNKYDGKVNKVVRELGVSHQAVKKILDLDSVSSSEMIVPFVPGPTLFNRIKTAVLSAQSVGYRARSGESRSNRIKKEQQVEWEKKGLKALRALLKSPSLTCKSLAAHLGCTANVLGTLVREKKPARPTQGVFDKAIELYQLQERGGDALVLEKINLVGPVHINNGSVSRRKAVDDIRAVLGEVSLESLPDAAAFRSFVEARQSQGWSKTLMLYSFFSEWLAKNPHSKGLLPGIPELQKRLSCAASSKTSQSQKRANPFNLELKELHNAFVWLVYEGRLINRGATGHLLMHRDLPPVVAEMRDKTKGELALERARDWLELRAKKSDATQFNLLSIKNDLALDRHQAKFALSYFISKGYIRYVGAPQQGIYQLNLNALEPLDSKRDKSLLEGIVGAYKTTSLPQAKSFPEILAPKILAQFQATSTKSPLRVTMSDVSSRYLVSTVVAAQALREALRLLEANPEDKGKYCVSKDKGILCLEPKPVNWREPRQHS